MGFMIMMAHCKFEQVFIVQRFLFSPWVKGTRQLLMAAETIPQRVVGRWVKHKYQGRDHIL